MPQYQLSLPTLVISTCWLLLLTLHHQTVGTRKVIKKSQQISHYFEVLSDIWNQWNAMINIGHLLRIQNVSITYLSIYKHQIPFFMSIPLPLSIMALNITEFLIVLWATTSKTKLSTKISAYPKNTTT